MVKGLAGELRKAEPLLAPLVREHVHHTLQELLQNDLTGMIKHAVRVCLYGVCCVLHVVCRVLHVVCCVLHVVCRMLHVACLYVV